MHSWCFFYGNTSLSPCCFSHHRHHATAFINVAQQTKACTFKGLDMMDTAVQLLTWQCMATQLSSQAQSCHGSLQKAGEQSEPTKASSLLWCHLS